MKLRLLPVLFLILSTKLYAQLGGTTVFNALNINGSARAASLGGNYLSMKDGDVNLVAANPSLLDSTTSGKLSFSYVDYFAKTNFGFASYAKSLQNKKWTIAGTMQYFSYGKMTELDGLGYELGEFSAGDYALTIGSAYQYDSLWSLGANLKAIYSNLANYYSFGMAADLAATYNKPKKNFSAAIVLKNIGIQLVSYTEGQKEKLPAELQVGFIKRPRHAPFRFSVVFENLQTWNLRYDNPNEALLTDPVTGEVIEKNTWEFGDNLMRHVVIGTEFILTKNINIRLGYNYRRRQELKLPDRPATAGISFGFGFKVSRFYLSYGRAIYHVAGPSNHFTVTTDLSKWI
ncbi:MAG: type IX secretion system protein PorQ [Crocinitomicaceae bacterium]|nr:type IX secretion system protein PorQ [Crocinitomicaceae bacterium]